tara:strand:- start:3318 stop:4280 length:963 start_codon:yes stop_codon:yes gene_type:complete
MDSFHEQMEEYSFPYYEPEDIKLKDNIGEGGTGKVYNGTLTIFGDTIDCIVKQVSSDNYDEYHRNRMMYQDIIDEVKIGHRFMSKSKYLIQFYGYTVFEKDDNVIIYLLMEKTNSKEDLAKYLGEGEFWKKLTKKEHESSTSPTKMYHKYGKKIKYWDYIMPVKDKLNLIKCMCLAVQELHKFMIVHCDLKLNNMVYTGKHVKLIDYGASQDLGKDKLMNGPGDLGTPGFMAPEMSDGWISYQADIYSVGVCILEIWFGDIWPSETDSYHKNRQYVLDYLQLLKKDNVDLYKLVKKCVSTEYTKRPLIKTVLSNLRNIQS